MTTAHTAATELDPVIHAPTRLAIVALLAPLKDAEFGHVRDKLELSDSALSKQITQLHDAGYVDVRKGYVGKRPRTWVSLSKTGRAALARHLAALKAVIAAAEQQSDPAADLDQMRLPLALSLDPPSRVGWVDS